MKARTSLTRTSSQSYPFNGNPIRLTIGILVSNSIKTIRRCLDSICPILEHVPSELIVTDTGGTDGSIEIAREYTSHIEKFTWCDDFAAARNVALKSARGEWFLYLDDDEWFEDASELIEFFNSGECDKYNSLSYVVRNYIDYKGVNYDDSQAMRATRRLVGTCFQGMIHELLNPYVVPEKKAKCYAHHYGYVRLPGQPANPRKSRNVPLLERVIEKAPDDLHAWYQLTKEYGADEDWQEIPPVALKALQIYPKESEQCFFFGIARILAQAYIKAGNYEACFETSEQYISKPSCNNLDKMSFCFSKLDASICLKRYEDAKSAGKEYCLLFDKIKQNPQIKERESWGTNTKMFKPKHLAQVQLLNCTACFSLKEYTEAMAWFDKINLPTLVPTVRARELNLFFQQIANGRENGIISHCYQTLQKDGTIKEEFIVELQNLRKTDKEMHRYIAEELANFDEQDSYCKLNRLYLAEIENDTEGVRSCIDWFIKHGTECCGMYRDVLITAMQFDLEIAPLVESLDMEDWQLFFTDVLADTSASAYQTMMKYYQNYKLTQDNIKFLHWQNCMLENIVLYAEFFDDKENKGYLSVFRKYTESTANYAHAFYKDNMFTAENLQYLPRVYRFAYHMEQAQKAKQAGDLQKYLQGLKDAMQSYPVMKKPLKLLIDRFEYEQLEKNRHAEEFFELAKQVKAQIEQLITEKKIVEAKQLIEELAAMLPNDGDLGMYRLLVEQAEFGSGLSTQMPQ